MILSSTANNQCLWSTLKQTKKLLTAEIKDKSVCVIGGAGSIGFSFIRAILRFRPGKLIVVDLNENGLTELTRDIRSTEGLYVPKEYRTYTLNFADPIFERIFREEKGFDIVANSLLINMFVQRKISIVYKHL